MKLKIGDSELELLQFVAERDGCTVREASEHFAQTRGWGRTTVLKTMDRLIAKGYLTRSDVEGVFSYRAVMSSEQLQKSLIETFFSKSLGGSLHPLVAYLDGQASVSDEELAELKNLVTRLEERRQK